MTVLSTQRRLRSVNLFLALSVLGIAATSTGRAAERGAIMPDPPIGPYQSIIFGRTQGHADAGQIGTLPPLGYAPGIAPPQVIRAPQETTPAPAPMGAGQFPPLEPQNPPSVAEQTPPPAPVPSQSTDTRFPPTPPGAEIEPAGPAGPTGPTANPYQAFSPFNSYGQPVQQWSQQRGQQWFPQWNQPSGQQYRYPTPGYGTPPGYSMPYGAQPNWFPGGMR
jgi:hypothetical protein